MGRAPGRPRSAQVDEAIIRAVLDLIADGTTVEALSIEAVAAKAGVGKATIYRRWPGKDALVVDAIRTLKGPPPVPAGESVRADLITLLSPPSPAGSAASGAAKPDERVLRVMSCMVPEVLRTPARYRLYQGLIEPRREAMREVIRRGIRTGELRADLDIEVTVALLSAPVMIQRMLRWHPTLDDATLPERVVDTVLAGLSARPE